MPNRRTALLSTLPASAAAASVIAGPAVAAAHGPYVIEGDDGIGTDHPGRLRKVAAGAGYRLPPAYEPRG